MSRKFQSVIAITAAGLLAIAITTDIMRRVSPQMPVENPEITLGILVPIAIATMAAIWWRCCK